MHRQRQRQASLIEAIASGYGGCKTKEGLKALQAQLDTLRRD